MLARNYGSETATTTDAADSSATTSSETAPATAPLRTLGIHISKAGHPYCVTVDQLKEILHYIEVTRDKEAAAQMITDRDCGFLPAGLEIDVIDTKILSGMIQFRKRGTRETYWTEMEAI